MTQYIEVIHDIENDEVTEREYSAAEIKLAKEAEELLKQELAKEDADKAATEAARADLLSRLGITADEAKLLLG